MKIEYKLLDNSRGVILTRQPQVIDKLLDISFVNAPPNATAIFESAGVCFYRALDNGACSVPSDKLDGEIKVTVAIFGENSRPDKWVCEELKAEKLSSTETLVSPNDMALPLKVIELQLENEQIRGEVASLKAQLDSLEKRFVKMLEGYDLI